MTYNFPVTPRFVSVCTVRMTTNASPSGSTNPKNARNKLEGDEAREDVSHSQQVVRQVRLELEEILKMLRR